MSTESLHSLAVLGAGKMGGALVRAWVRAGACAADQIRVYDPISAASRELADAAGVRVAGSASEAAAGASAVLLSVKPDVVLQCLDDIGPSLSADTVIISIAAGVRLARIEDALPHACPVLRVMPNTPALIGEGASGFCRGTHAGEEHAALVSVLFGAVGRAVEVDEKHLDAVTGLSGSGPAYVYLVIEALIDAGVRAGLPRDAARTLAVQTVVGAARMVQESGAHPGVLKDAVTTPGGTTIAGLSVLEREGLRGTLIDAVLAAAERAREMG